MCDWLCVDEQFIGLGSSEAKVTALVDSAFNSRGQAVFPKHIIHRCCFFNCDCVQLLMTTLVYIILICCDYEGVYGQGLVSVCFNTSCVL